MPPSRRDRLGAGPHREPRRHTVRDRATPGIEDGGAGRGASRGLGTPGRSPGALRRRRRFRSPARSRRSWDKVGPGPSRSPGSRGRCSHPSAWTPRALRRPGSWAVIRASPRLRELRPASVFLLRGPAASFFPPPSRADPAASNASPKSHAGESHAGRSAPAGELVSNGWMAVNWGRTRRCINDDRSGHESGGRHRSSRQRREERGARRRSTQARRRWRGAVGTASDAARVRGAECPRPFSGRPSRAPPPWMAIPGHDTDPCLKGPIRGGKPWCIQS